MHQPDYRIVVEIPALDALVAHLRGNDQAKVSALADSIQKLTARLLVSSSALKSVTATAHNQGDSNAN